MKRTLVLAVCLLASGIAEGAPRGVGSTSCEPLGSTARKERLSQLLSELGRVRRVKVENWSSDDPVVWHAGGSDVALMTALAGQVNLLVRYAAARECPGQWRVSAIWVLPKEAAPSADRPPASVAASVPSPSERAALELYLQGHGSGGSGLKSP